MKTGRYSLKELLTHHEIDQLVIPELQRDYVWEKMQVERVWNSLKSRFQAKRSLALAIQVNNEALQEKLAIEHLTKQYSILQYSVKMGFVYAYHDPELAGKFFLIDGQQRMTTFYLLLLVLYVKLDKQDDFKKLYFYKQSPKLDYKVRESAYEFMRLFLSETLENKNFEESTNYFAKDYEYDVTVGHLIANYRVLNQCVEELGEQEVLEDFLDFIENYVEFNYFDTQLSDQGEKLYLYMNSRGFHLSHQEKLRANLIKKCTTEEEKKEGGKKWEEWQDFFFEHRYTNENADKGFEEFLYYSVIFKLALRGKYITDKQLKLGSEELRALEIDELDISFLNDCFESLKYILFDLESPNIYIQDFFQNTAKTIKLWVRYLPLWYSVLKTGATGKAEYKHQVIRFRNFLLNFSHTSEVASHPSDKFVYLMEKLTTVENYDVMAFLQALEKQEMPYIEHEIVKLNCIQNKGYNAEENHLIENVYFDYQFNELLQGRTDILLNLVSSDFEKELNQDKFSRVIEILKAIFFEVEEKNKLKLKTDSRQIKDLNRYILTYFNFAFRSGSYLGKMKVVLVNDGKAWVNRVIDHEDFINIIQDWEIVPCIDFQEHYQKRRENYSGSKDWRYYVIKYDFMLEHTKFNQLVFDENPHNCIVVAGDKHSKDDAYFPVLLYCSLYNDIKSVRFDQYNYVTLNTDLIIQNDELKSTRLPLFRLAIDLEYKLNGNWSLQTFYRGPSTEENYATYMDALENKKHEVYERLTKQKVNEGYRYCIDEFFTAEKGKTLEENWQSLKLQVNKFIEKLTENYLVPKS